MDEVSLKRFAGPYREIPFISYIQSPVGLVPKAGGKTRMIFHLSYDFKNGNKSVNYWTPQKLCSVKYSDLDCAVRYCLKLLTEATQLGSFPPLEGVTFAKSDLMSAFRILPCSSKSWPWLVITAKHPVTGEIYHFVNKNLPFRASISCSHFQRFSNCLKFLMEFLTQ